MSDPWVAFVSARLADDEAEANCQHRISCGEIVYDGTCDCGVPDSIRGWCATGRHILGLHTAYQQQGPPARLAVAALEQVIEVMASNYRHHPDHPGNTNPKEQ